MESKLNDDQLKNDPFEVSQESEVSSSFTLLLRAFGYLTLAGYSVWALTLVIKNISNLFKLEADALSSLAAVVTGKEIIGGGLVGWKIILFIFISIWAAVYFIRIRRFCIRVIIYRWRWIWVKIAQISFWGWIIRLFGLVLVLAQFIFCICITIITIIIVWINFWVLVGIIF